MEKVSPELQAQRIYKVSEITREIRMLLEDRFPLVWIEGEISNFKNHSSGHMYFSLKDEAAFLNCVFFSRQNQYLKFAPKDGLKVIAIGRISVYDLRGTYQLYVERLEPKGLGALQLAFLQMKEKLQKEGLFEEARKREIPKYPKHIGLVTSPTGAAIQDMLKVFNRSKAPIEIQLIPVKVQGDGAAEEIAQAIQKFNKMEWAELLIVGRGGGSLEDLWSFNEEVVARSIFTSQIPVISAVGHEIDWTIADLVADYRAHTPTAGAECAVMHWNDLGQKLADYNRRLNASLLDIFNQTKSRLEGLLESYAFRQPKMYLDQAAQKKDELVRQLGHHFESYLQERKNRFQSLVGKMDVLSPLHVLERGYSIALDQNEKIIRSIHDTKAGDLIHTRVRDGVIKSKTI